MGCQYQTKSMNASALNLYKCGHIQKVEACMCSQFFSCTYVQFAFQK